MTNPNFPDVPEIPWHAVMLVFDDDPEQFLSSLSKARSAGWELHGNTFVWKQYHGSSLRNHNGEPVVEKLCQVLVRPLEEKHLGKLS